MRKLNGFANFYPANMMKWHVGNDKKSSVVGQDMLNQTLPLDDVILVEENRFLVKQLEMVTV